MKGRAAPPLPPFLRSPLFSLSFLPHITSYLLFPDRTANTLMPRPSDYYRRACANGFIFWNAQSGTINPHAELASVAGDAVQEKEREWLDLRTLLILELESQNA